MLLNTINKESDPYRISIEPLEFQLPLVNGNLLQMKPPKNTFRLYFRLETPVAGQLKIRFTGSDTTEYTIYSKFNDEVTTLASGYYIAVFAEGYVVLVNDNGLTKDELLKYDLLGKLIDDIYGRIDTLSPEGGGVRTVNLRMPDGSGNVNTGFAKITAQLPSVSWNNTVFLEGTTEFNSVYDTDNPQWYNLMYPTRTTIPEGTVTVRTIKDSLNGIYMQQIDSVEDGSFEAQFFRLGLSDNSWDTIQLIDNGGGIKTINGESPDSDGNINVSNLGDYKMITPIPPTEPESEYPLGTSAFITYYDSANMPDWEEIFNNPDVPDGEMFVVTVKTDSVPAVIQQRVDMTKDGLFVAEFIRIWNDSIDNWTPLMRVTYVESINDIRPDINGNIIIPNASTTVSGLVKLSDTPTENLITEGATSNSVYEVHSDLLSHMNAVASDENYGHVKVDGETIVINDGVISAISGESTPLVNNLTSTSTTSALTANMGKTLKDNADAHALLNTTDGVLGHILLDNHSLINDGSGKTKVVVIDSLQSTDATLPLSANMGNVLDDDLTAHKVLKASNTVLGHVMVDNDTITIDSNGVISIAHTSARDYKLRDTYYDAFIDEGDVEVVFSANISDMTKVVIKFYDEGMILNPNTYTYTYSEDDSEITFTLNNPKAYPVTLLAIVTEVIPV